MTTLLLDVHSEGPRELVEAECQRLADKLGVGVSTLLWPENRDANSVPTAFIQFTPRTRWERFKKWMGFKDEEQIATL